uniref:Uncharacterized protein n=1 Tax=Arundo donax TaxID=35708 RepID=A0A0A8ZYR8_ARUDO
MTPLPSLNEEESSSGGVQGGKLLGVRWEVLL